MKTTTIFSADYIAFLTDLKDRIRSARLLAGRSVNREHILLYWDIGQGIVEKQKRLGWGESVIDRLSQDLFAVFPGVTGFSPRNLRDMKRFFLSYSSPEFWRQAVAKIETSRPPTPRTPIWQQVVAKLQTGEIENFATLLRQAVAEIPWGQHLTILNKVTDPPARLYYLRATVQFGWSRSVLLMTTRPLALSCARKRTMSKWNTH